jgi:DnaJ-class molecular chaperone
MASHYYYETLGVSKTATDAEIRKAYKKLAKKYHPDNNSGEEATAAAAKFKEVQEANSVLGDKDKRAQYDRFGSAFQGAGGSGGPGGGGFHWNPGGGGGPIDLGDLFGGMDLGDLFGGGGGGPRTQRRARPQAGQNFELEIEIPLQLACEGGSYSISIRRPDGGVEPLNVRIPAGITTGQQLRLSGQGHPGAHGGPAGDALLKVKVAAHPWFRREGDNLLLDLPLSPAEAALGAKVEVPTLLQGRVTLTVPPGTSTGGKLRLPKYGVTNAKTKAVGDQIVVVKVVVPKSPTAAEQELYRQLAEIESDSARDGLW